ncbi:MAG TPA: 16S rRNA (guanine(966)-N(2))-methyltransferase RsmD [Oxalicibacterium sp.]|nr:16S rRNA (guanine(966)-N(2))-methyltransferase RsmD [Oxalicibacterium sp.]
MAKPSPVKKSPPRSAPHQVRIIGGQWKRTPLAVLDAAGLRPTPDRVRETVFNWINHLIDGGWGGLRCLDAFAGTGVLGFEAASRGATEVVMVEMQTQAVRQIETIKDKLHAEQVRILRSDAISTMQSLQRSGTQFDLIFLDPPYHSDWLARSLPLCVPLLRPGGLVYVESEMPLAAETSPEWLQGWQIVRADSAGMVYYHLLQPEKGAEVQA